MTSPTTRNGLYILFMFLILGINEWMKWMTMFEVFLIIVLTGMLIKLTDIHEAIMNK